MTGIDWKQRSARIGILALATGGFVGFFPFAPGTWGSVVGVGFMWTIQSWPWWLQLALALVLGGVGVWSSEQAGRILRKADASPIVLDEIVGVMVALIGIPMTPFWLVMGFLIFRFFDIVKIPPCDTFDRRFKNGWGVMLDDVVAGIYTNILLRLMLRAQF